MTSKIKVDNINKVSDDSNIINKCGTTITLGASGDSIALASGASQSGFGRTGTVDWQTGSIKTGDFTAVNTQGFFVDTNGGAVAATLPSGSAGAIISFQDYRNTFDTANLTITPASGEKINGGTANGPIVLSTEGEGVTLVYIDSTVGWRSIQDNDFAKAGSLLMQATGGSVTDCGDFKIHTFTGPGTFCVSRVSPNAPDNVVDYTIVAGGAGGGSRNHGGGGGAGGYRESAGTSTGCYTASPLGSGVAALAIPSATGYPVTVGAGGAGGVWPSPGLGTAGGVSTFSTITSAGGGGGGASTTSKVPAIAGGSGGGGTGNSPSGGGGGASGNTPPVSPPQQQLRHQVLQQLLVKDIL